MGMESHSSPFESQSFGNHCHELFEAESQWLDYDAGPDNYQNWVWRSYEHTDYPNKYDIAQFALNLGYQDNPYLVHSMYVITAIAMEDDEDGFRKINQWYISYDMASQQEEINYLYKIVNPNLSVEEAKQGIGDQFKFAIESGLSRPNQLDLLELSWVIGELKQSQQDNQE